MTDREIHVRSLERDLFAAHRTVAELQRAYITVCANEARLVARVLELEQQLGEARLGEAA